MKDHIREFILQSGSDDVGFAAISNYHSPRSPRIEDVFPDTKTIIVSATKEPSHCISKNPFLSGTGRDITIRTEMSNAYKLVRHLETQYHAKAMIVPSSYFINMAPPASGFIGEISLRHAAVAAGLGSLGRNNLLVHPKYGSQVYLTGVLTDLEIEPDEPMQEQICTQCGICVKECPVKALDKENFTDTVKCIKNTQPYGMSGLVKFWKEFSQANSEEQKKMVFSENFIQLQHTQSFGMHYTCYNCYISCPSSDC